MHKIVQTDRWLRNQKLFSNFGSICEYSDLRHLASGFPILRKERAITVQCNTTMRIAHQHGQWSLMIGSQKTCSTMTKYPRIISVVNNHQSFSSLDSSPPPLPFPILIFFPTKFVFFFLSAWFVEVKRSIFSHSDLKITPGLVECSGRPCNWSPPP